MSKEIKIEDLQGHYDITYATIPQMENFYEPGFGSAKIEGNKIIGVDALGVIWNATFTINEGQLEFKARLDPSRAPETVGLLNKSGVMTREPQNYEGIINVTKFDSEIILRTKVQQGPMTINVQFRKK